MKTLISTSAIIAAAIISVASSASAQETNTMRWDGATGTIGADGCTFVNRQQGVMALGTGDLATTWTTTRAASVSVRSRGRSSITVTSDNVLRAADGSPTNLEAVVNYTGSTIDRRNGTASVTATELSLTGINSNLNVLSRFNMNGTAPMRIANGGVNGGAGDDNLLNWLANNSTYHINHTVTCTQ
jgi:hypothetical protein